MTSGPVIATDDERFQRQRSVNGHSVVLFVFHSCTCLLPVHRSINCIKMLLPNKTTKTIPNREDAIIICLYQKKAVSPIRKKKKIEKKKIRNVHNNNNTKNNNDTCRLLRSPAAHITGQSAAKNYLNFLFFFRARNFLYAEFFNSWRSSSALKMYIPSRSTSRAGKKTGDYAVTTNQRKGVEGV